MTAPPPANDLSDEADLLDRLRANDPLAFEQLVRLYFTRLRAVARRILRNEEDTREAVQDAFLSVVRSIGGFDGAARLSTWLHRITINAALMKLRRRRRHARQSICSFLPSCREDSQKADSASLWQDNATQQLERRETCDLVRRYIDCLPEVYRTILVLRDIEERDTDETARLLGVGAGVVKTRLHRARQALRSLLDPHFRGGTL